MYPNLFAACLIIAISWQGCPDQQNRTIDFVSEMSVVNVEMDSVSLLDCQDIVLKMTFSTEIRGLSVHDVVLTHSDVSLISAFTGTHSVEKLNDSVYQVEALPPGHYLVQYTVSVSESVSKPWLIGEALTLQEPMYVKDPTAKNIAHIEVKQASCATCNDGSLMVHWLGDRPHDFWWSTGDKTDAVYHLPPGDYQLIIPSNGLMTCHIQRSATVGIKTPLVVDEILDVTRCQPSRVTTNYAVNCDSLGMMGQLGGTIDFDLGQLDFASLSLDHLIQLELGYRSWKSVTWKTIYRLSSASQILSEGNVTLEPTHGNLGTASLRLPLLDFIRAGGFDVGLSLRIYMGSDMSIQSVGWKVLSEGLVDLRVQPVSWLHPTTIHCTPDTIFLGPYFAVTGGSTPYQYFWDLDGDSVFQEDFSSNPHLIIGSDTTMQIGLQILEANGAVEEFWQELILNFEDTARLQFAGDSSFFRDSLIVRHTGQDAFELLVNDNRLSIDGPGLTRRNTFDPAAAGPGIHTLSVGTNYPCIEPAFLRILVFPDFDESWSIDLIPDSLDCDDTLMLNQYITGDTGGFWFLDGRRLDTSFLLVSDYIDDTLQITYGKGLDATNYHSEEFMLNCTITALSTTENSGPMEIFPNPTRDWIFLDSKLIHSAVSAYAIDGKEERIQVDLDRGAVDVRHLNNGIYFLRISTGKGVLLARFVKI